MTKAIKAALLAVAALALGAVAASAYVLALDRWLDGTTVQMQLALGPSGGPLFDGSPDWDAVAEAALADWNAQIDRVQFQGIRASGSPIGGGNGHNNVYFSGTVFGDTFPSNVLAVAVWWYNPVTNQRLESDVIFNTLYSWNSYRGPLSGVIDMKRVALHEFGHVLGLHHPDQSGQSVTAIMNSVVGNLDSLAADDIAGGRVLYGTPRPQLTGVSSSVSSPQTTGTAVTFTAHVTGGATPYQYKWWLFDGSSWSVVRDWSTTGTFTWTPVQPGSGYRVGVWVRNAGVTADDSSVNLSIPFVVTASHPTLTGISSNRSNPQPVGTAVTFTANATGGTAPYQYKWWLFNGSSWSIAQDWSTTGTFTWTPTQAGTGYRIGVWIRNAGVTADDSTENLSIPFVVTSGGPTITGISSNLSSPQPVGTAVTFTANVTGGTAPYQYKWWLFDGSSWSIVHDWSTNGTFTWTPSQAGSGYRIGVWVRNAGVTADDSSQNLSVPFVITATSSRPTITGITSNLSSPQAVGTPVTFTTHATGGTAPYQYKWWLFNGSSWSIVQDWSTTGTFTWTPSLAGSGYRIGVWVRSAGVTADDSSENLSVPFVITATSSRPTITGITSNLSSPQAVGTPVTFTTHVTGGTAPYQYKWWLFNGSSWSIVQDWSTTSTFTWTPSTAGSGYRVGVWVRNAGVTADDSSENLSIPFVVSAGSGGPTLTSIVSSLPSPQSVGTPVTFTANVTGGVGPHQFKWWLFNGSTWTIVQDWSTSWTFTWTPSQAGSNYRIGVWVRNAGVTADDSSENLSVPFAVN